MFAGLRLFGRRDDAEAAGGTPLFEKLGDVIVRRPWWVIGFWLVLAVVLPLTLPSLTEMTQRNPVAILPADAPVVQTTRQMTEAFQESGSENVLLVVLTDPNGMSPADETTYRDLVDSLRRNVADVVMLQDFVRTPPLRELLASDDGKAWILPIGIAGELGTPQSFGAFNRVSGIIEHGVAGSTLQAYLTGPASTVADLTAVGKHDQLPIELAVAGLLIIILLIIYRNPFTMALPLITIGASLVTAQSMVSGLAVLGLGVSNQTTIFLTAMMAGAGTDYAVFLISRYHDFVRLGVPSSDAVKQAMASIGKVIAASAATVMLTFFGIAFAKLGLFSTAGIALSLGIGVAFLAAMTLLPAILVLAGARGWVKPRPSLSRNLWRRSGVRIVRRPVAHLVASVLVLLILAGCAVVMHANYDDRKTLPDNVASSVGYAELDRHFSLSATIPQYLVITSPHDLRTPEALADLEQMAQRISQLPDIAAVRGITRPSGEPLEQAKTTYQAGQIGGLLQEATTRIDQSAPNLNRLASGADELAVNLRDVRGQVTQAVATVDGLVDALTAMQGQFGGAATFKNIDSAIRLVSAMRALGDSIGGSLSNMMATFDWLDPVMQALDASAICTAAPACVAARGELHQVAIARDNGAFDRIAELARQLQSTRGNQSLDSSAKGLRTTVDAAMKAIRSMGLDRPGAIQKRLTTMQQGAATLADASRQVADGVQQLVDEVKHMGGGLQDASSFLLQMKTDATKPSMTGFYLPPEVLTLDEFKQAARLFISPDGHSVRYTINSKLDPFSTAAMDQVEAVTDTARGAQPNTVLADASVSVAGYPAVLRDTRDYYERDLRFIIAVTIIVVLLILIVLLRSIVAPLYLVASVAISYVSALGIGVVVFQFLLGQQLHWSIPGLTFIILVAVGADYNMLVISRIRDESPNGVRSGVIRTVGSTGGVITAAGVIFAASMFSLLFSSITTLVQAGFIVGVGVCLDTFLVRTITVPAVAAIIGRANWWPSRLARGPVVRTPWPAAATAAAVSGAGDDSAQ